MILKIRKMKEKKGFTLIELMIVVAILGVLAAVAIPQYLQYIATSKRRATLENYENARRLVKGEYARIDAGNTPRTVAELVAELNGETWLPATATFDGVPINFNPYNAGAKIAAFQGAIAAAPGQTGLTCTYAGGAAAPVSGTDSCTVSTFYVDEDGNPLAAPVTSTLNYD